MGARKHCLLAGLQAAPTPLGFCCKEQTKNGSRAPPESACAHPHVPGPLPSTCRAAVLSSLWGL